ncbi:MAG: hypothetical protein JW776_07330 [Candidatus Lokiarchaeota archaeon]|nr:hypothetical protein [Candidatus Lokiarchaeota archaeon]
MTPKYNPKHKKRKNSIPPTKQANKYQRNKKIITLGIIAIVIGVSLAGIFVGKFSYDEWVLTHIQIGDKITVELFIWIADDNGNNITGIVWNNTKGDQTFTIEETANETGIPYGLWDQLIGMENGSIRERLWLPRCVDDLVPIPDVDFHQDAVAGDGYDDRYQPGLRRSRCYSFGYNTISELGINLRYTPIIYRIHVLELNKKN